MKARRLQDSAELLAAKRACGMGRDGRAPKALGVAPDPALDPGARAESGQGEHHRRHRRSEHPSTHSPARPLPAKPRYARSREHREPKPREIAVAVVRKLVAG